MKKYKIYFFDVDGTLAKSKGIISQEIAELLSELSQNNKIAIISGETFDQIIKQVINELPGNAVIKNFILLPTSGAALYICKNNDWQEIYKNTIPESRVVDIEKKIYQSFKKHKISIPKKNYGPRLEYRGSQITFSVLGQDAPFEIKSKWDPDHKKRKKIVDTLEHQIPNLDIKIGGTNSIDITLKGIDKSYGIIELTNYLKVSPKDCVFIGDAIFVGGNDFEVFETGIKTIPTSGPDESSDILRALIKNSEYQKSFIGIIKRFLKKVGVFLRKFFLIDILFFKVKKIELEDDELSSPYLTRSSKNPVLSPTSYSWEDEGVFNPAAIYLGGRVHLLYRAIGSNGVSTIGYASSKDGIHFDERLPYPIYYPKSDFELDSSEKVEKKFNPNKYSSGGSWSGCEDPKICQIGDRIFLTYVAFSGWDSIRIAMSSITVDDFLNKRWRWTIPILCTKKGVISKSGGLFPEKVNGKYVFFQRIFPNILIDYLDDLHFKNSKFPEGEHEIPPQKEGWDSRKISFGATPIKTKYGWLVVTHGVDDKNDHQYHIGVMLLDLDNPEKIIYRSNQPILSPELWYENDWKPGVVYPCGAVNKDGTLLIYYGGGDKYVCVASAPFEDFLESLLRGEKPKLKKDRLKFKKR